ncbi:hypothetical protein GJ496_000788 [Pomphorhynchus laevis]|nr:hypothetical protein GJ496_000788 [Pomphorhynchus laevis]
MDINNLRRTILSILQNNSQPGKSEIQVYLNLFSDSLDDSKRSEALRTLCKLVITFMSASKTRNMCSAGKFDDSTIVFVRFINLIFLPDEESRKTTGKTLADMANDINFPAWLIELRHQISHQAAMPPSETIWLAIECAIAWISHEDNFKSIFNDIRWKSGNFKKDLSDGNLINELLFDYYKLNLSIMRTTHKKNDDIKSSMQRIISKVAEIESVLVANCLCKDGFLFPNWRQAKELGIETSVHDTQMPAMSLIRVWKPILKYMILKRTDFLSLLLTNLCEYCCLGMGKLLATAWVKFLLENYPNDVPDDALLELSWNLLNKTSAGLWNLYEFTELITCALLKKQKNSRLPMNSIRKQSCLKANEEQPHHKENCPLWQSIQNEQDKMLCIFENTAVDGSRILHSYAEQDSKITDSCKIVQDTAVSNDFSLSMICNPSSESVELVRVDNSVRLHSGSSSTVWRDKAKSTVGLVALFKSQGSTPEKFDCGIASTIYNHCSNRFSRSYKLIQNNLYRELTSALVHMDKGNENRIQVVFVLSNSLPTDDDAGSAKDIPTCVSAIKTMQRTVSLLVRKLDMHLVTISADNLLTLNYNYLDEFYNCDICVIDLSILTERFCLLYHIGVRQSRQRTNSILLMYCRDCSVRNEWKHRNIVFYSYDSHTNSCRLFTAAGSNQSPHINRIEDDIINILKSQLSKAKESVYIEINSNFASKLRSITYNLKERHDKSCIVSEIWKEVGQPRTRHIYPHTFYTINNAPVTGLLLKLHASLEHNDSNSEGISISSLAVIDLFVTKNYRPLFRAEISQLLRIVFEKLTIDEVVSQGSVQLGVSM